MHTTIKFKMHHTVNYIDSLILPWYLKAPVLTVYVPVGIMNEQVSLPVYVYVYVW